MARSVGEAAAAGLESGFRIATDYGRQRRAEARQAQLDEQQRQQQASIQQRQDRQDRLGALEAQAGILKSEGAGLASLATPPDEATQRDFTSRVQGVSQARNQLLGEVSGYDIDAQRRRGEDGLKKLQSGQADALQPGELSRAITVATGRNPNDFVRAEGRPSMVEKAAMDFMDGMETGDFGGKTLSGLNSLFTQELRKGVGTNSPHGKIVAKQIVQLVPDPNNPDPNEPRVIPVMRIFVNSGKEFKGPIPEGMPEGSTGYYDAPLTQNRSSDPNDPVKSIGMQEAMDYIGKQMDLVQQLNDPESVKRLQADAQVPDWNPDHYLAALTQVGAAPKKETTIKDTPIPAGGSVLRTVTDAQGRVVSEKTIQGNEKKTATAIEKFNNDLDAAVASGVISEEEAAEKRRTAIDAAARGGGVARAGSNKLTPLEEAQRLVDSGKYKTLEEAMAVVRPSKASSENAARLRSKALGDTEAPQKMDEAVDFWARAVLAGDKDWQVGLGRSKSGSQLIESVKRRVPQMAKEFGLQPSDIGTVRAQNAALGATLKELTKRNAAVELFSNKLEKDMATLDSQLDKAAGTGPLVLNEPINALRRKFTTDGAIQGLDLAAKQVGTEYERLITGGTLSVAQLHAGASEDAKKLINGDMSPKQARSVMAVMRQEMRNAQDSSHEAEAKISERMRGLGPQGTPGDAKSVEAKKPAAPAVGTVKGGYRFKGGNPADKASWEKV